MLEKTLIIMICYVINLLALILAVRAVKKEEYTLGLRLLAFNFLFTLIINNLIKEFFSRNTVQDGDILVGFSLGFFLLSFVPWKKYFSET